MFLLPQLVSIRTYRQTLTALTLTSDPDKLVITPPSGTTSALDSGKKPPHHRLVQSFECPDLPDIHPGITEPWSIQQGDTVVQLPHRTSFDTTVNCHSQSPADSLVDSAQDRLTDRDHLSQSLDTSQTDSSDNSLDILLPELPTEMKPVQLMNQLLTQLTTKPSTEIRPNLFTGTTADNILDWIGQF